MPEDIRQILTSFKNAILVLVMAVLVAGFLISKIIPIVQSMTALNADYTTQTATLADKQRQLADLQAAAAKKEDTSGYAKEMFSAADGGADSETLIAGEFTEILKLIKDNGIKTRSVKYDYDPADDNFIKGAQGKFSACLLSLEMVAGYNDFENFLKELYKHEHFLDISKIELVPYQKNKSILLINFQVKLYAKK